MFTTIKNAFKVKEIRHKILMTLLLIAIYRLCCFIPVPGLEANLFSTTEDNFFGLLSAVTGGALANGAFLAMGIVPYINASIIMQLLTYAIPRLERLSKKGEEGRRALTRYTRYATIVMAILQALGIVLSWNSQGMIAGIKILPNGDPLPNVVVIIFLIIVFTAGTAFAMWIGEKITEYGIGNGISLLIFVGILSTAGNSIFLAFVNNSFADIVWNMIGFVVLVVALFMFIIFVDSAERKIPVHYAKQVKGRKLYGGQTNFIPMKLNASGVLPIIFAFALITFPQMIFSFWPQSPAYAFWARWFGTQSVLYFIVVALLIVAFSYFYASMQFNAEDVSRNIQANGGNIPGIRQGKPTTDYLKRINNRLTLFGAIFLAFIATIPSLLFVLLAGTSSGLATAFSATGLLIVVSVALEFNTQLEAQLMMRHYKGFLE